MRSTGKLLASSLSKVKHSPVMISERKSPWSPSPFVISNEDDILFDSLAQKFPHKSTAAGQVVNSFEVETLNKTDLPGRIMDTTSKFQYIFNANKRHKKEHESSDKRVEQTRETILDVLNELPNISCWQQPFGFEKRRFVSATLTK